MEDSDLYLIMLWLLILKGLKMSRQATMSKIQIYVFSPRMMQNYLHNPPYKCFHKIGVYSMMVGKDL